MFEDSKVSIYENFEFYLLEQDRNFLENFYLSLSTIFTILFLAINHLYCLVNQNDHITEKVQKFFIELFVPNFYKWLLFNNLQVL